jgi:hypothetical protein
VSTVIRGDQALQSFRRLWSASRLFQLLDRNNGRLRINWAVGVGKSYSIDAIIEEAVYTDRYDLVIALFPTRRLIHERAWIKNPPSGIEVLNLRPRPTQQCGSLDSTWVIWEKTGLAALGRTELCANCPHLEDCFWPRQYGPPLQSAQVVFATHAHLARDPHFISFIQKRTEAERVLVLYDETHFLMTPFRRRIPRPHLERFVETLEAVNAKDESPSYKQWIYVCRLLLAAPTHDLRVSDWQIPSWGEKRALAIQQYGWDTYGEAFHYLARDLHQFCRSPTTSRERTPDGDLLYTNLPHVRTGTDFILYSGTTTAKLAQFRFGREFASPFEDTRFEHPGTRWYNIASGLGARCHFQKNAPQILDFYAGLAARRLKEERRPLLIAKKCFVGLCVRCIQERIHDLGLNHVRVVNGAAADLQTITHPHTLPIIHYGMIGVNTFEHFDSAYCLTSFNVNEEVVNTVLQDIMASDRHIPIQITCDPSPRRRKAAVTHRKHRYYDINELAQLALQQQEIDVVIQAVGRVRPYTKPREIIMFQCAEFPDISLTQEFESIGEAREYFGIPTRRERLRQETAQKVQAGRQAGRTQKQVAKQLGVSIRTVKRYWNP